MATIGYGTKFEYSTDTGETWEQLGNVKEITPPEITVGDVDTTHLLSTDAVKTSEPGMIDPGEVTFNIAYDATAYDTALSLLRVKVLCRITYPDHATTPSKLVFPGYINSLGQQVQMEEETVFPIKMKVAGKPVFTKAGS